MDTEVSANPGGVDPQDSHHEGEDCEAADIEGEHFRTHQGTEADSQLRSENELLLEATSEALDWNARTAAANELSRLHYPLSTEPASQEQMLFEAELLGLEVRLHAEVGRFDQRPPEVIAAEGFAPNPQQEPGTLYEHIERKSCSYVSCSELGTAEVAYQLGMAERLPPQGELTLERVRSFVEGIREEWQQVHADLNTDLTAPGGVQRFQAALEAKARLGEALSEELGIGIFESFDTEHTVYEYRAEKVEGVRLEHDVPGFSFAAQREITTINIPPENVTDYREVRVRVPWMLTHELELVAHGAPLAPKDELVDFGEWQSLHD